MCILDRMKVLPSCYLSILVLQPMHKLVSYFLLLAPTDYPDSLSTVPVSTTTILLSWSPPPPDDHNGIIREYLINMTELDSGRKWQLTSTTISVTIHSLHPYYLYECTVSAYTMAAGPYSEFIQVRTPEDDMAQLQHT